MSVCSSGHPPARGAPESCSRCARVTCGPEVQPTRLSMGRQGRDLRPQPPSDVATRAGGGERDRPQGREDRPASGSGVLGTPLTVASNPHSPFTFTGLNQSRSRCAPPSDTGLNSDLLFPGVPTRKALWRGPHLTGGRPSAEGPLPHMLSQLRGDGAWPGGQLEAPWKEVHGPSRRALGWSAGREGPV